MITFSVFTQTGFAVLVISLAQFRRNLPVRTVKFHFNDFCREVSKMQFVCPMPFSGVSLVMSINRWIYRRLASVEQYLGCVVQHHSSLRLPVARAIWILGNFFLKALFVGVSRVACSFQLCIEEAKTKRLSSFHSSLGEALFFACCSCSSCGKNYCWGAKNSGSDVSCLNWLSVEQFPKVLQNWGVHRTKHMWPIIQVICNSILSSCSLLTFLLTGRFCAQRCNCIPSRASQSVLPFLRVACFLPHFVVMWFAFSTANPIATVRQSGQ